MPDGVASYKLADGVNNSSTMRGMGFGSVNPPKATSMVGPGPELDSEFVVIHTRNRQGKTSCERQVTDHRDTNSTDSRRAIKQQPNDRRVRDIAGNQANRDGQTRLDRKDDWKQGQRPDDTRNRGYMREDEKTSDALAITENRGNRWS
jgi:hypothetical protein